MKLSCLPKIAFHRFDFQKPDDPNSPKRGQLVRDKDLAPDQRASRARAERNRWLRTEGNRWFLAPWVSFERSGPGPESSPAATDAVDESRPAVDPAYENLPQVAGERQSETSLEKVCSDALALEKVLATRVLVPTVDAGRESPSGAVGADHESAPEVANSDHESRSATVDSGRRSPPATADCGRETPPATADVTRTSGGATSVRSLHAWATEMTCLLGDKAGTPLGEWFLSLTPQALNSHFREEKTDDECLKYCEDLVNTFCRAPGRWEEASRQGVTEIAGSSEPAYLKSSNRLDHVQQFASGLQKQEKAWGRHVRQRIGEFRDLSRLFTDLHLVGMCELDDLKNAANPVLDFLEKRPDSLNIAERNLKYSGSGEFADILVNFAWVKNLVEKQRLQEHISEKDTAAYEAKIGDGSLFAPLKRLYDFQQGSEAAAQLAKDEGIEKDLVFASFLCKERRLEEFASLDPLRATGSMAAEVREVLDQQDPDAFVEFLQRGDLDLANLPEMMAPMIDAISDSLKGEVRKNFKRSIDEGFEQFKQLHMPPGGTPLGDWLEAYACLQTNGRKPSPSLIDQATQFIREW